MKFNDSLQGGTAVFQLSGKIIGGKETAMFHGRMRKYLNLNKKHFVIDLAGVERLNSVGLGMLTSAYVTVKKEGGHLVLANITSIESLLSMTRLISVFPHFDSTQEAISSVGQTDQVAS